MPSPSSNRCAALLAATLLSVPAATTASPAAADAASFLELESVGDGRCQILSDGGKLRIMHNRHPAKRIAFRLQRTFAGKLQGLSTGEIEPGGSPVKLGCTRVDGRPQDWVVERARFQSENLP